MPTPSADKIITCTLSENDLGQLLDGVETLIQQWDNTYRFHAFDEADPGECLRDCASAIEAKSIRDHYRRIGEHLYHQLEAARKTR